VLVSPFDDRPIAPAEIASRVAREGVAWAAIAGPHRWLDEGDLVAIAPGGARLDDVEVTQVLRAHRLVRLDHATWRTLARRPRLFAHALRAAFAVAPWADAFALPTEESRFFDDPDVLAASAGAVDDGLWDVEERIAERYLPPGTRLLDVGCGTGREAIAFARRGIVVHAIDPSRSAIEHARRLARERDLDVTFDAVALADFHATPFDAVFFASDVVAATPARGRLLARARELVRDGGVVAYQREVGRGRLARSILSALGRDPGDTLAWHGPPAVRSLHNVLADEHAVVLEARAAALAWEARIGVYVVARREPSRAAADPLAIEMARVAMKFPLVDRVRRELGPKDAASAARRLGADAPQRDALGRAQLRKAIALCDRAVPRGGGCYRRVLLEVALDAGAAKETIRLGLHKNERRGHAWLDRVAPADAYDLTTSL
jgi:SAM-dependent methyltransferase